MKESVTIVCDLLLNKYGSSRPAYMIAEGLFKKGYPVKIISNKIDENLQKALESEGMETVNLSKKALFRNESLNWFQLWLDETFFTGNSRGLPCFNSFVINFSNTIGIPSHVWYVQGLPTVTIDNMKPNLPWYYDLPYTLVASVLAFGEKRINKRFANFSKRIVANSQYSADMYENIGLEVESIIYPPLDCNEFKPSTPRPTRDYLLTYFGKETNYNMIKEILKKGIKVKSFGSKLSIAPKGIRKNPNLEHLAYVSNEQLIDLYSNALFTLFPFTDEPFGYIPVESMACGTPVLTYNKQGPKESVINGVTGWLADDDKQFLEYALDLWRDGYSSSVNRECRKRAHRFSASKILSNWINLLESMID